MERKNTKQHYDTQQDTGWSWAVAVAAFAAHLITHGIVYSFGILFITIQDNFHGSKAEISWIPSLTTGCLYLIGPLASILINRYGCRTVTIFGSILGCLGYMVSVFVRKLFLLYITMGILAGCGFGMVFLPSILIVTKYFNKYRSLACGLALSGAGGGAFVFSPLLEYLIAIYAWKGSLLLMSAIILNCIPCGLLYQSVSSRESSRNTKTSTENNSMEGPLDEKSHLMQSDVKDVSQNMEFEKCNGDTENRNNVQNGSDLCSKELISDQPIVIEIVHNQGRVIKTTNKSTEFDDVNKRTSACSRYIILFRCTEVVIFFLSQFLFFAGFYLPFIYIPDKARGHGIHEGNAAWIASTIGISSILGRIVLGYLADRPFVNRMVMFKTALLVTGISTSLLPVLNTLWSMLIYAVIYGVSTGITLSLTSVVLVDIVGLDLLSDAMGLNNLFSAFGSLLGPPVAGLLYDKTQSYAASFLTSGISMSVSGLMLILAAVCRRKSD